MQQVHINRLGVNSIEFEAAMVELPLSQGEERSFELVIINYGAPTHVNLTVNDSLRENVTILEDNPYVRHEEYIPIIARIPYAGRLYTRGQMFVTVGYGSKKAGFDLNVGLPGPGDANFRVDVDSSLSTPRKTSSIVSRDVRKGKGESWSAQLPEISVQMLRSVFELTSSRSVYLVAAFVFLLLVVIVAMMLLSIDFESFFGFYPSVLYSILLTFLMAYLLVRLPIFK